MSIEDILIQLGTFKADLDQKLSDLSSEMNNKISNISDMLAAQSEQLAKLNSREELHAIEFKEFTVKLNEIDTKSTNLDNRFSDLDNLVKTQNLESRDRYESQSIELGTVTSRLDVFAITSDKLDKDLTHYAEAETLNAKAAKFSINSLSQKIETYELKSVAEIIYFKNKQRQIIITNNTKNLMMVKEKFDSSNISSPTSEDIISYPLSESTPAIHTREISSNTLDDHADLTKQLEFNFKNINRNSKKNNFDSNDLVVDVNKDNPPVILSAKVVSAVKVNDNVVSDKDNETKNY